LVRFLISNINFIHIIFRKEFDLNEDDEASCYSYYDEEDDENIESI